MVCPSCREAVVNATSVDLTRSAISCADAAALQVSFGSDFSFGADSAWSRWRDEPANRRTEGLQTRWLVRHPSFGRGDLRLRMWRRRVFRAGCFREP